MYYHIVFHREIVGFHHGGVGLVAMTVQQNIRIKQHKW